MSALAILAGYTVPLLYAGPVLLSAARALRAQRSPAAPAPAPGSYVILRPCAGAEAGLTARLAASPAPTVPLVATADDGAAAAIDAAGLTAIVTGPPGARNPKVAQLIAGAAATDAPILVVADSDVALDGETLAHLLAPFADPAVTATWAPPVEVPAAARTFGDRLSGAVLGASLHAFPLLARLDGGGFVGKLFAIRREALRALGGFAAVAEHLGEDMELGRLLRARGGRVVVAATVARAEVSGRTAEAVVARYARWLQVIRAQRPALLVSYPLLLAAGPVLAPLAAVTGGLGAAAAVIALRALVSIAARRAAGLPLRGAIVDGWLADGALLLALGQALGSEEITWRGRRLRIAPGGRLAEIPGGR